MKPPAVWRSQQGLLLVEAVLSAVIIAVGLVFISRGLSSQLNAIRTIQEHHTLLSLAQGKLVELESEASSGRPLPTTLSGGFDEPYGEYRWSAATAARDEFKDQVGRSLLSDVLVTVAHDRPPAASVQLGAIWLKDWLPQ